MARGDGSRFMNWVIAVTVFLVETSINIPDLFSLWEPSALGSDTNALIAMKGLPSLRQICTQKKKPPISEDGLYLLIN